MSQNYYQQKFNILGGVAVNVTANTSLTTTTAWEVEIDYSTAIIKINELGGGAYMKLDGIATSSNWDYYIANTAPLEIANFSEASFMTFIGDTSNTSIKVAQY